MVVSIVERTPAQLIPDSPAGLFGSFADRALVGSAAASLPLVSDPRHLRDRLEWLRHAGLGRDGRPVTWTGFGLGEGPQLLIEVSPGTIRFRRRDYARLERAATGIGSTARDFYGTKYAAEVARIETRDAMVSASTAYRAEHGEPEAVRPARILSWSRKSRANMAYTLNALDYSPLVSQGAPAMVTLTYPGEWLSVAPSASVTQRHMRALRKRFARAWNRPLVGVWKREFQRRGAPHFHLLMVAPAGEVNGQDFAAWLSSTWAAIVDHQDPVQRMRHELAGTGVDYREGSRYTDPRRVGAYFSKHGLFSAKDYQNEAPSEWVESGEGIGRFWGTWGLSKSVVGREVEPEAYDALRRTTSRYQAATHLRTPAGAPATVKVPVWRKVTTVDKSTGEVGWKWRRRMVTKRIRPRLTGRAGFLAVNDGPGFVMQLSRQVTGEGRSSFREWSSGS